LSLNANQQPVPTAAQIEALRETLKRAPEREEGWIQVGNALFQAGENTEAIRLLQEAANQLPASAPIRYNLGYMLEQMGQFELASACYQEAIKLNPEFFEAWYRMGEVAGLQRQHSHAIQAFQRAFQLRPNYLLCLPKLLEQLTLSGDTSALIQTCEIFLAEDLLQSSWFLQLPSAAQDFVRKWQPRVEGLQIFAFFCREELDTPTIMRAINDFTKRHAEPLFTPPPIAKDLNPEKRLRIGYLSNEMCSDTFYQLSALLFEHQNQAQFDYFAYNDSANIGPSIEVLQAYFQTWREVQMLENDELYKLICADDLDILVDMSGLINPGRLAVTARKPAPILIMNGSNPPFTSGLKVADWLFSDPILTPPEIAALYPEKIWHSDCFLHWTLPEIPYDSGDAPYFENGYITFGSSNSINKYSESTLNLWCKLLKTIPKSRLFLKNPALDDQLLRKKLQNFFFNQGISSERVLLQGALIEQPHLPYFYGQVDIALDTFPYNGGLTTFEALWMGVPVISMADERRVGASVLSALGLSEWICQDADAYLKKAQALALDPDQIQNWRQQLRQRVVQSPLCDGPGFAQEREQAYRKIWQTYCQDASGSK
jgi:protein O-GlcNAc transferase